MNVLRKVVSRGATTCVRWQPTKTFSPATALGTRSIPSWHPNGQFSLEKLCPHPPLCAGRQWLSTSTPPVTTDHDHAAIIVDCSNRIQACALQGDAEQAQLVLDELESLLMTSATTPEEKAAVQESLLDSREAVLDAWISHQATLFQEWRRDHQRQSSLTDPIVQAAKHAHEALEKTVPFLTRAAVAMYRPSQRQSAEEARILEAPEGVLGSPSTTARRKTATVMMHRCNAVLTAWARASRVASTGKSRRGIPQRATYLLQRMEASLRGSASSKSATPTTESYNRVLEAWAWSQEHLRATMAEQLFQSMLQKGRKKDSNPDGDTYKWIIQVWCKSREKNASFIATGHLMNWLRRIEKGREHVEPTVETYQMVMEAWSKSEDRSAPIKAMGILQIMEHAHAKSHCSVAPDETCYRHYLVALARRSLLPEQGPLADKTLTKFKFQQIVPDEVCYTAAIQTWKNSALNPLFGEKRESSIARAVELLQELSTAHHRSALVSVKPTTQNYNDVLQALTASTRAISKKIADTLVQVMEDSISEDEVSYITPNADTYKWLLTVHAQYRAANKIQASKQVMKRSQGILTPKIDEDSSVDDAMVGVYNAFLRVCESVPPDDDDAENVLQEALGAVEEMRSLYHSKPNSQTYAILLDICKTHLDVGPERSRIVQSIFQSCCEEGLCDSRVLRSVKAATSDEHYFELVLAKSGDAEGERTRLLPESWTRSLGVQRIVPASGQKAAPLSVDGRFTITRAMKEQRMRKLRSKVNQSILQGGRLKVDRKKRGEAIIMHLDQDALSN